MSKNWPLWLVLWSMVRNVKSSSTFNFQNSLILLLWEDLRPQYLIDVSQLAVYVLAHLPEQRHWAFIQDMQVEQQWQQALSEWDVLWKREYLHKKPVKIGLGYKIMQHCEYCDDFYIWSSHFLKRFPALLPQCCISMVWKRLSSP